MRMILSSRFFVEAELMPFRTSPVVGEENDKRVVQFTVLLQRIQYPSDIPIHDIDHSGKDCHPTYQIFLPVFGQTIPCRKLVIRFILKEALGHDPARAHFRISLHQSQFANFLPAVVSYLVPTLHVGFHISIRHFFRSMQRKMRSIVSQI